MAAGGVSVRELTPRDRAAIASWRYPGRYSTYDVDDPSVLASDTWAVTEADELIGYCCFGAPARVPGAREESGTLDVGYGLAPDLMGHGRGRRFVGSILEFALEQFNPERLRLYILEWNVLSRRWPPAMASRSSRSSRARKAPFSSWSAAFGAELARSLAARSGGARGGE
jgi:[ribosomal protein S18]-alanine N-acetyltransferase